MVTKEELLSALEAKQGKELCEKFAAATVAVCGLGGLGSNIATCLVRAGVGKTILIDFDKVDVTNLHRQQYFADQVGQLKTDALKQNLLAAMPFAQIETHAVRLDETNAFDLLKSADVVCEAFDDAQAKAMLADVVLAMQDKILVAASGMAGFGSANEIKTKKINDRFYLCGDGVSDVSKENCLVSSRVMLCAAHQAQTILRILAGETEV